MPHRLQLSSGVRPDVHQSYPLAHFDLSDMIACGAAVRQLGSGASSMEMAASRIVEFLYRALVDERGESCCPLVRCFKTHPFEELPNDLAAIAESSLKDREPPDPTVPCVTLLGTAGDRPEWKQRSLSTAHQTIPLVSVEMVEKMPMISRVMEQMGLSLDRVLHPDREFIEDAGQRSFNVFYVPDAQGSPYVPAQQGFVDKYKIRSVLGFGGLLPTGDLFFVLLFCRIPIDVHIADLFRTVALSVKLALLPFTREGTFEGHHKPAKCSTPEMAMERIRSQATTLGLLIPELESVALRRTKALKTTMVQLNEDAHADALTGIANRRAMDEVLAKEFSLAFQTARSMAILLIDIDHFKLYNDRFGHLAGDECLRSVAQLLLKGARRPADFVARYGGEEFLILLPDTDLQGAMRTAERARTALFHAEIDHPGTAHGRITISVGCTSTIPTALDTVNSIIERADRNLYEAKRTGRNRIFPGIQVVNQTAIQI